MWRSLSLALLACILVGCRGESETGGVKCKPPEVWKIGDVEPLKDIQGQVTVVAYIKASCLFCLWQATRLDELRQNLEDVGFVNISYVVVNSQDETSHRLHTLLEKRLSDKVALYNQNPEEPDVWSTAKVEMNDIQIYDRCGRLTHHMSMPYTILKQPHVEKAIRSTYCTTLCGDCELQRSDQLEACNKPIEEETPRTEEDHHHHHHHHHHHGGHHHGRHHHGRHHHGSHHHPHDGGERHGHGGHHDHEGQDSVTLVQRGSLDQGQVQRKEFDLGQVHVRQVDLGYIPDKGGNLHEMQRPRGSK